MALFKGTNFHVHSVTVHTKNTKMTLICTRIVNLPSAKMRWEKALRRRGSDETDYRNLRTTVRRLCVEQILDRVRQATGQLSHEHVEVNNPSSSKCADRDDRQII